MRFALSPPVGGFDSPGPVWIEALPARVYQTPQYGEVPVTVDKLERMVKNFKGNVRGQEVATDFDHGMDKAKGNKASGWYRDFEVRPSSNDPSQFSLYAAVELTDEAKAEIEGKQWKYFSLEWDDQWQDNDGKLHSDVITGGGFTNRPIAKKMMPINFSEEMVEDTSKMELVEVIAESKDWEHSEPGTGNPPEPRREGDGSEGDPAIEKGWRWNPLPLDPNDPTAPKPGGKMNDEQIAALFERFEVSPEGEDAGDRLLSAVSERFSEVEALKKAMAETSSEKNFAEEFPTQFREHQELLARDRIRNAHEFSESISRITASEGESQVNTNKGLSALALQQVEDVHKKFAEGTVTLADFEEVLDTVVHGGIVDFSENGSTQPPPELPMMDMTTPQGVAQSRKLFAEKVAEIQREDAEKYDTLGKAIVEASKRYPELAEQYKATAAA